MKPAGAMGGECMRMPSCQITIIIHLNPVRAGMVPGPACASFPWTSLRKLMRLDRPDWMCVDALLKQRGFADSNEGWSSYIRQLAEQAARSDERDEFAELCTGWAIETAGWKRAVAKDLRHLALDPGYAASQLQEIKQQRWRKLLDQQFVLEGKLPQDAGSDSPDAPWKIDVAVTLRRECVPYAWISQTLAMGGLSSIRGHVFRREHRTA